MNTNNTDRKVNNLSNNSILSPLKEIQNNNIDLFKKTGQKEIKENIINNDSYNDINNNNIEQVYFGVIFPTEQKVKNIYYKNNDTKKIIALK